MQAKFSRNKVQNFARRWHRRLGVIVGLQFLFWTIGGTYFAWFHIENVRGNMDKNPSEILSLSQNDQLVSLESVIEKSKLSKINKIELSNKHNMPTYWLEHNRDEVELYDATSGERLLFTKDDAIAIAKNDLLPDALVTKTHYITERQGEYGGALPAYRIDFDNWKATHIYVHEHTGMVTARRNAIWRGFDFLWMLHILDFQERNNFNNWLLKTMSILGLISIILGYLLWATTTPLLIKRKK